MELIAWFADLPFMAHAPLAAVSAALLILGAGRSVRTLVTKTY